MNTAYDLEVRKHCPKARSVYNLFHVVAQSIVPGQTGAPGGQAGALVAIEKSGSLGPAQQVHLNEVLQANQYLMAVYVMKGELKSLWTAPHAREWRRRWRQWLEHARQSNIPVLMCFAQLLKPYWRGILSRVRCPMHTGHPGGHQQQDQTDQAHGLQIQLHRLFFLKIKAAFLSNS